VNSVDKFLEWNWCNHVEVEPDRVNGLACLVINKAPTVILRVGEIEYLLCGGCFVDYHRRLHQAASKNISVS
jgi:hypothetical protein